MNTPTKIVNEWSGSPADEASDDYWVDDDTGEYINAATGERMNCEDARNRISAINGTGSQQ